MISGTFSERLIALSTLREEKDEMVIVIIELSTLSRKSAFNEAIPPSWKWKTFGLVDCRRG